MRTIKIDILLETEELGDANTLARKVDDAMNRAFFIVPKMIIISVNEVSTDEKEHRVGQLNNENQKDNNRT